MYNYKIKYACALWNDRDDRVNYMVSSKQLKEGDFVIVERAGQGVFIGQVVEEVNFDRRYGFESEYFFVQELDLTDYIDNVKKAKRKLELRKQMQERFKLIDEERKYEYYADFDDELKTMYEEYKDL